jgi:hypothetical protein
MDGPDPFYRELARLVAKAAAALYAQTKGEKTNISLLIGGGEAAEATPGQDTVVNGAAVDTLSGDTATERYGQGRPEALPDPFATPSQARS